MRALFPLLFATLIAPAAQAQQAITMTDLKIDADALAGQVVQVRARVQTMGPTVVLTDPAVQFDTSGVMATMDNLDRDSRAYIVSSCGMGCVLTITGEVSSTFMGPSLEITAAAR